jgi:hypothetical protein
MRLPPSAATILRRLSAAPAAALTATLCLATLAAAPALAQFATPPAPLHAPEPSTSVAESPKAYRADAARHLYHSYPMQVLRGRLPPVLYAVAVVETTLDASGQVLQVEITREPAAAKEVMPWLLQMIRRAAPYPAPQKLGEVVYTDVWLVDRSGRFQLDTLTEGQRSGPGSD